MSTKTTSVLFTSLLVSYISAQINPIITPNNLNIKISAVDLESTWAADSFFLLKSSSGPGQLTGFGSSNSSPNNENNSAKLYHKSEMILDDNDPNWQPRNLKLNELNKIQGFSDQGHLTKIYDREFFIEIYDVDNFFLWGGDDLLCSTNFRIPEMLLVNSEKTFKVILDCKEKGSKKTKIIVDIRSSVL